ncbi:MAG: hypothetical protein LBP58_02950, partial [Azoarcus sp.]|nr:hypothetical protein [Azoarcus sp.]
MNYPLFPRSKVFLGIQAALALMIVTTPTTALGDDVTDENVNGHTYSTALTVNNPSTVFIFAEDAKYFDLNYNSVIIGDINGSENTVTLSNGTGLHVIGELWDELNDSADSRAEGNIVTLTGGSYADVAGGLGTGKASAGTKGNGNTVNISNNAYIIGDVLGGFAVGSGNAVENRVNITGGSSLEGGKIFGGYSVEGQANGNTVFINTNTDNPSSIEDIYGGYAATAANNNHVTIRTGSFSQYEINIAGGEIAEDGGAGDATENSVTIEGGTFSITGTGDPYYDINIMGGAAWNQGNATGNAVNISGGDFSVSDADNSEVLILGGGVFHGNGNATGNTVNLSGSVDLSGSSVKIYGGAIVQGDGNATGNTITVDGSVSLTSAQIHGGYIEGGTGDAFTGNALVFKSGWTGAVGSAQNFAKIVFENGGGLTVGTVTLGDGASATTEIETTGNATLGATLSGTGFEKTGQGTLTLTGTNSHGSTTIREG